MFSSGYGEVEVAVMPSPLCAHVMPENGSNKSYALDHCEVEVRTLARKISRLNLYFFFNGQRTKSTKKKRKKNPFAFYVCFIVHHSVNPSHLHPLPSLPTLSALSPHLQTSTVVALLVAVVVVRLVGLVLLFNQQQQHANNLCTRPLLSWIICLA